MTVGTVKLCSVALAVLLVTPSAAYAGVVVRSGPFTMWVDAGSLRFDYGDELALVYNTGKRRFILFSRQERAYAASSFSGACAAMERAIEIASRGVSAAEAGDDFVFNPDVKSENVRFGGVDESAVQARYAGPGGQRLGFETERYRIFQGDALFSRIWITDDERIRNVLNSVAWNALDRLDECGVGPSILDAESVSADSVYASREYRKLMRRGVLVRGIEAEETFEVDTVTVSDVEPSRFQRPKGYREIGIRRAMSELMEELQ